MEVEGCKQNSYAVALKQLASTKYMWGVDRGDQLHGYFKTRTKCRKFYKYIFWFLFNVAIINVTRVATLCLLRYITGTQNQFIARVLPRPF